MARCGPLAIVDLETSGLADEPHSEIVEFGALLLDPGVERVRTARTLVRPERGIPSGVRRLTGLREEDLVGAPALDQLVDAIRELLAQRVLVAHNAHFERHFLTRLVAAGFEKATYLDSLDLLALTHPDAPDLRLESFTRLLLGEEEQHRAMSDALDTARILSRVARGSAAEQGRYRTARQALERFAPDSAWLALLGKEAFGSSPEPAPQYLEIGPSAELPVPFEAEAIAAALADEVRGRRHFPGYRVRREQIRLARHFVGNLARGGMLLLEGGTGVGKSLAYLAAAIPFAAESAEQGGGPVVISTRTRLLQDQLLAKDIGAVARMLGYPELRALSIKGRTNYVCARRLEAVLEEGREARLFPEERHAYAALLACARTRPYGEVGTVPGALLRRFPLLRDLLHRSVSTRPEQCSREQCAHRASCAFGRRRGALAQAHLVVANHDLLLRWPPDYPRFAHAIVDEVHELADIADEVYSLEVRPQEVLERIDEIFGRPGEAASGEMLLPAKLRRSMAADASAWRRDLRQDLVALGRSLEPLADFGEVDLPARLGARFHASSGLARTAAQRLEEVCDALERVATPGSDESALGLERARQDLREWAAVLRLPFEGAGIDQVASFEALDAPYDRWRLVVRRVDPSEAFHRGFLEARESFAGVSASVFVQGDAFAALGELDFEQRVGDLLQRDSLPSPFPYAQHMRVVALEDVGDLVEDTSEVLAELALRLHGRTLGLFTSLRRMNQVADRLATRLHAQGIDVLTPRRAADDPNALVTRFMRGSSVLLGARKFWQGLDIPGPCLQAVVIEKLPFEVPTELRKRREERLRARGEDAFGRYTLGKMLLHLKQMCGRLIRTEEDRGLVVIVEGRPRMRYFRRLEESLPAGVNVRVMPRQALPGVLEELGLGGTEGGMA
jgi:Rad3-related DNA helicase